MTATGVLYMTWFENMHLNIKPVELRNQLKCCNRSKLRTPPERQRRKPRSLFSVVSLGEWLGWFLDDDDDDGWDNNLSRLDDDIRAMCWEDDMYFTTLISVFVRCGSCFVSFVVCLCVNNAVNVGVWWWLCCCVSQSTDDGCGIGIELTFDGLGLIDGFGTSNNVLLGVFCVFAIISKYRESNERWFICRTPLSNNL